MADNIINAVFGSGICAVTTSAFRANYGMVLRFSGIDLPTAFEVDFSNYDVMGHDSITAIGQNGEVQIPDQLWDSGLNIYAYVYLHPTDDSGVTVYTVTIPVLGRPNRTEEEPTPHEQSVIEQAISALNDAVEQTAADVETTAANAQAAAQSEANASVSERAAAASASAALASQNAAESASQSATESASGASESARNAANSASQAAESATSAQESAEQAERSVQSIGDDVERSERAAATATDKATEAASSAATASTKATQAEQSATAAAQSAQSASTAAQNAAESEQLAESHATDAEQAKQAAQDAQAAAEQAAQSVSGLSAQITQNTADIADLVQSKAGALIDTASGSIASFVPDATIPTVKGLTVNVEPVQDLHGYDNPWPAGGGVNLLDADYTETITLAKTFEFVSPLPAGQYTFSFISANTSSQVASYQLGRYRDETGSYIYTAVSPTQGFATFTNTEPCSKIILYSNKAYNESTGFTTIFTGLMIKAGGTGTYSPYSNICPITGWTGAKVTRTGKNLLNPHLYKGIAYNPTIGSTVTLTDSPVQFTDNHDGTFSLTASSAWLYYALVFPVKDSSLNYRLKLGFTSSANGGVTRCYLDKDFKVLGKSNSTDATQNFNFSLTPQEGYDYYCIILTNRSSASATLTITNPQIELGSTATAYEPYNGDTYTIQLGQTVYGGKIYATQGKMVVDRAMDTFDGDEYWYAYDPANYDSYCFTTNGPNKKIQKLTSISNMYKNVENAWGDGGNGKYAVFSDHVTLARWYFTRPNEAFEKDVSAWKAWLAENPLQVCYELATPITVDLTPLEISVLTGQTNNIWADSGDVSVEYAADLKTYINNKIAAAVAALS